MHRYFDWQLIQAFLAAFDNGSLLGASRQLGRSQPTVGRQLAELEEQLDTVLFERTGRGLKPTPMAHTLVVAARQMASAAATLQRQVQGNQSDLAGSVRLSASQPVACLLLPPLLRQMRVALPSIEIELVVSNEVSNLLEREADIALRMVRPEQGSLVARRIANIGLSVCASQDYLQTHPPIQQPSDLLTHALIGFDRDTSIIDGFAKMGHAIERSHFVFRTDDLMAYWEAIRAGIGVGFVSDYAIASDPRVQRVLPQLVIPGFPLWLTVHREIHSNPRIRAVYDFLGDAVPKALNAITPGTALTPPEDTP